MKKAKDAIIELYPFWRVVVTPDGALSLDFKRRNYDMKHVSLDVETMLPILMAVRDPNPILTSWEFQADVTITPKNSVGITKSSTVTGKLVKGTPYNPLDVPERLRDIVAALPKKQMEGHYLHLSALGVFGRVIIDAGESWQIMDALKKCTPCVEKKLNQSPIVGCATAT